MADGVVIRLLGPVTAARDGAWIDLGSPRRQALVAVLAACPGRVVPMLRIIDSIWGDAPPRTAEQSVYTYVAGLRNVLEPSRGRREPSRLLAGGAGGYRLQLDSSRVDALVFTERVDRARRALARGDYAGVLSDLDEAIGLWHGEALTGVPGPFAEGERDRLTELRLAAQEFRAEALLGLDRPQDALTPLRTMIRRHPLCERPRELLMLALLRCGRPAESLVIYDDSRRVLRAELGAEPGEALRRARQLALAGGTADRLGGGRSPLPRQLPRDLTGFVGRAAEIIRLKGLLAPWDGAAPHPLVVISGPPGVGKSALAVRIGNLVKDRYPDGQLYVNLRGATVGLPGLDPLDVLGRFLRASGVDGDAIPGDVDEAAALWRSTLAGRRTLVLLDDAAGLRQILPLIHAPSGTAVVVTSRETLAAGDDCVQLHLPRLSLSESVTVLAKLAGAERMAAHPEETAGLVRLCDGLPLALRIAGARLADRPTWSVSALTDRLRDERRRLHELEAGELAVRASLAASWSALAGSARPVDRLAARALGLLGLLHLHDVTAVVAAALLGAGPDEAERALERLVDAHLLEHRADPGRYQLHDLVRLFAAEMAPGDATAPLTRALSYYIASARLAVITMDPHRVQAEGPEVDAVPHSVGGPDEAIAWLAGEEANLVAAAAQAMSSPHTELARLGVALCFSLFWYQHYAHEPGPLITLNRQALELCERLGDRLGAYHAHGHLSCGLFMQGKAESMDHLQAQLVLAGELGDRFSEQRTLGNLANQANEQGLYEQALDHARRQLALARGIGAAVGVRYALMMLGRACQGLGRPAEARRHLRAALAAAERIGDTGQAMNVLLILGEVCLDEGDPAAAAGHLERALAANRSHGNRLGVLQCLVLLSRAHRARDDAQAALPYVAEAVPLAAALENAKWRGAAESEQRMVHGLVGVPAVRV
ncbi:BTAD domain-containing putative transcriptional regulator [Nonomuraea sp. MCN248]|uniref:BTAD domain-containing putative transcriptional regulator n=1 Tax=Nonomuraea corallina TaxID=2989783 RepID=A0ABT4SE81_9ACTN|nr:BTAD domain-containing putative transcriptional regulator [Nonomuraea corallina]MDA0635513.1 BTAD domain-containing putative transcriptional regulator [Nonomuraea corallina]